MKKNSHYQLRVVIIHNIISPHIEPVFQELAKEVDLMVLYCAESEDNRRWAGKPSGFKYQVLPNWSLKLKGADLFTYFINPSLFGVLQKIRPDVVIISGWDLLSYQLAAVYCKLKNIPYILWSGSTHYELSWRRTVARPLVQLMIAGAGGFLAYGLRARDYLLSLGADPAKITIAYNTTNLKRYFVTSTEVKKHMSTLVKKYHLQKKIVILFYGQLIERKRPDILIQAFANLKKRVPNAVLLIVGSGQEEKKLHDLIKKLKLSDVEVIPDPGDDDMPAFYHLADIFVLSSQEEVWGLVVNQAMAASVPVIVSNKVGAGADLITEGETGSVFSVNSVENLTQKMMALLQNKKLRVEMGAQARKRIQKTSPQKVSKSIYQRIVAVAAKQSHPQHKLIQLVDFPTINDDCSLSFAQAPQIPFSIARVYYMYDIQPGLPRGFHAHKETQQIFVCLRGSVKVIVDDGRERAETILDNPATAIFFDKMIWHEMYEFTEDAVVIVFASEKYDPQDYIRDYKTFLRIAKDQYEISRV